MAEETDCSVRTPQSTIACDRCGAETDVKWFCKNCPASLCAECKEKHSTDKLMKKHEVVLRTGSILWAYGSWKVTEPCRKHKNRDLQTFCIDCEEACCVQCIVEHPRHSFDTLENKYYETESRLNSFVTDLLTVSLPELQNEVSFLKQKIDSCDKDFEKAKSEIDKFYMSMKNELEKSCIGLKNELSTKQEQCSLGMCKKMTESEKEIENVESLVSYIEGKIRVGGLELIKFNPELPKTHRTQTDVVTPIPHFVPSQTFMMHQKGSIGEIEYDKARKSVYKNVKKDVQEEVSISDMKVEKVNGFKSAILVGCVKPVGDDKAWMSWYMSETVYLYDSSGKTVKSVMIKGSKGILDLAVKNNGDVILSSADRKVRRVSGDGTVTILLSTGAFLPQGICLTDSELVICMAEQDTQNHIAMFTIDGRSKIRQITATAADETQLLSDPYRVVSNNGQITVLNHHDNLVSVDQKSGKLIWIYRGEMAKRHKKFDPLGICCDKFSNFLITDESNHCVHYVDRKGRLIKIIINKEMEIPRPWGIGVDNQSGEIWCGSVESRNVWILNFI